jgi:hypothetical protein
MTAQRSLDHFLAWLKRGSRKAQGAVEDEFDTTYNLIAPCATGVSKM